jgi:uncharacterized protein (TIGR02466 family)
MLERAVALDPENPAFWYNLGIAALSAEMPDRAITALSRCLEIEPANAAAWGALGMAQQLSGEERQSEASLRKAVELDPGQVGAMHNLAVRLRSLDRSEEALAVINDAMKANSLPLVSQMLRADLLGDVGEYDDAAAAYAALIREDPGATDAHEMLARLLPQIDRASEQFTAYDEALSRAPSIELYNSALRTAWAMKEPEALRTWSADALRQFGDLTDFRLMEALAADLAGETAKAIELLETLVDRGIHQALVPAAYNRLKLGDVRKAESHAINATRANPAAQSGWAYLTIIWRLLEDEREHWLADYDRLVMPMELPAPEGFASIDAFMAELANDLHPLHATVRHPTEQSLRQGTQTYGHLFEKRSSSVRQLAGVVEQGIAGALAQLRADPSHPFLSRNTGQTKFQGSWSVRLMTGGFHVSHMHPQGWLSSALYVSLPDEFRSLSEGEPAPGVLTFGVPERELGLDLAARRIETPKVGKLVLFPSYFWHGTMPFESQDYRLTVAFDAAPV